MAMGARRPVRSHAMVRVLSWAAAFATMVSICDGGFVFTPSYTVFNNVIYTIATVTSSPYQSTFTCSNYCATNPYGYGACTDTTLSSQDTDKIALPFFSKLWSTAVVGLGPYPHSTTSFTRYSTNMAPGQFYYDINIGRTTCAMSITVTPYTTMNVMCSCQMGLLPSLSPTLVSTANMSMIPGRNVYSVASDASGTIWFTTASGAVVDNTLYMVPSPSYSVNVPTGIADCAYVWSNAAGSVFYFTTSGQIKQIV